MMLASTAAVLFAQTTADTGSIVGLVRDSSGGLVVGAQIAITNVRTGRVIELVTNSSGAFNSGVKVASTETFVAVDIDGKKAHVEAKKPTGETIEVTDFGQ